MFVLTCILGVPFSAQFCLGRWEFSRIGWAGGQDGATSKSKSTQLRSATTRFTLYCARSTPHVRLGNSVRDEGLFKKPIPPHDIFSASFSLPRFRKWPMISMGMGKIMVELCSAAILLSVCRYRSCNEGRRIGG